MQNHSSGPQAGDILVLVGTRKGTFCFWSDPTRHKWQRAQHHLGWSTHSATYDPRSGTIYAASNSAVYGALVQRSADGGRSWEHFNQGLDFGPEEQPRVREVWQVQAGHQERPGQVWAGTSEAGLFRSDDGGSSWQPVAGLNQHETRQTWQPGGGGLILHTILPDPHNPQRIYACISAGGAYRSDDGGASWQPINRGIRADFLPQPEAESGHCVHKMVLHPTRPDLLYQQNHCGVYRSDDAGASWTNIAEGLPSDFGFPIAIHPYDPQTIYVVPLVADTQRFVPDGEMAVWRSRNGGESWQRLRSGLPTNAWLTILREGLATDPCDPAGVYVGTTSGEIFYSRDEGEHWEQLANRLPPILSVHATRVQ